jgi:hypothetical protein
VRRSRVTLSSRAIWKIDSFLRNGYFHVSSEQISFVVGNLRGSSQRTGGSIPSRVPGDIGGAGRERPPQTLGTQQLADLVVSRFAGDGFVEVLKAVDVADGNENHMLIVALTAMGCIRGVVTTNFDTLLERTGAIQGLACAVTTPGISANTRGDWTSRAPVKFIKLGSAPAVASPSELVTFIRSTPNS